jgi:hypothetical protein
VIGGQCEVCSPHFFPTAGADPATWNVLTDTNECKSETAADFTGGNCLTATNNVPGGQCTQCKTTHFPTSWATASDTTVPLGSNQCDETTTAFPGGNCATASQTVAGGQCTTCTGTTWPGKPSDVDETNTCKANDSGAMSNCETVS